MLLIKGEASDLNDIPFKTPMDGIIQLDDLFAEYPPINDASIQDKITKKWEFAELASNPNEPVPKDGYFKHQVLIQRFIDVYHRLLVLHDTGTGKSFLIGALGEHFRKKKGNRGIKHVLVLVKGLTQEGDIKKTLVCQATGGYYYTDAVKLAGDEKTKKTNATKSLLRNYTIRKYESFANKLRDKTDEDLIRDYSDHIIIMDEIHNLRINPNLDIMNADYGKLKPYQKVYMQIWRLTHIPHRIKVLGLSASITINDVKEAGHVMNLVLPRERMFPFGYDFAKASVAQLNEHLKGMVSYVRALDTGIREIRKGNLNDDIMEMPGFKPYKSQLVVYPVKMSQKQTTNYARAFNIKQAINLEMGVVVQDDIIEGLKTDARQASRMVYPDGSWGNVDNGGFGKYYTSDGRNWFTPNDNIKDYYTGLDKFQTLSAKGAFVIKQCFESDGICVIFDEDVEGSGILDIAIAMEHMQTHQFSRFTETNSIFETRGQTVEYCQSSGGNERIVKPRIKPYRKGNGVKPRFAMIAKYTHNSQVPTILDTVSSYENRNGEYIKVIFLSGKAKEGISISNMRSYFQFSGLWNPSSEYQGKSRGIRSGSHRDLLADMVKMLIETKGYSEEQAKAEARIEVNMYYMVAAPDQELQPLNEPLESIDMRIYRYTEFKNREYKELLRKLKIISVDCQIHHGRNVRSTDVDNTPDCDYQLCNYECISAPTSVDDIDYSTYDVYYIDNAIGKIIPLIKAYFLKNGSGTLDIIYDKIIALPHINRQSINKKYILIGVYRLIIEREPLIDRFGYTVYLKDDEGVYYTSRQFPLQDMIYENRSLSFYGQAVITDWVKNLNDVLIDMEKGEVEAAMIELKQISPKTPDYTNVLLERLNDFKIENQTIFLEDAISEEVAGRSNEYTKNILGIFQKVYFQLHEPVTEIGETAELMAVKAAKKQTITIQPKQERIERVKFAEGDFTLRLDTETEIVYIHSLYSHTEEKTKYRAIPRITKAEGRIRLYKPSEGIGWRDTNPYETVVYNKYLQYKIHMMTQEFEKYGIYGIILADRTLSIRNKLTEDPDAALNHRKYNRGRQCTFWDYKILVDFMWYLEMPKPVNTIMIQPSLKEVKTTVSKYVNESLQEIEKWPRNKIDFYYFWSTSCMTKPEICTEIHEELKRKNMILRFT